MTQRIRPMEGRKAMADPLGPVKNQGAERLPSNCVFGLGFVSFLALLGAS